ncbi:MAG: glycosyltransferase [Rhodospirillales bacterium CG15_BIG_FIL_POST_REV_8_21_14_020_66_15]|nr:MAG: glycosyltransferase [Rhodospirillales bacterium CG15_BIG_FIL_POST_REV_8_21_14_020_66_15]
MTARGLPVVVIVTVLWAAAVVAAVLVRPLLPVDETRYLAVAWEMWQRGDFIVPYLNGEPYSHKPPLLFWAMQAGWALFGVNDWWPRLVAPLFGLAALLGTRHLGTQLWPDRPGLGSTAAALTLGALFWALFTTMTMFDMLHAAFAVSGVTGLVLAARGRAVPGFLVLGLSIGLGVLGKGPAILVHLLPAALAAPLWAPRLGWSGGWGRWYAGVAAGVALGAAIGLAWALPAAAAGGEAYRDAILWGQSAGRMVDSFAHGRPFWWFAAILPVMVLPWTVWPAAWRAVRAEGRGMRADGGVRLCLVWFAAAFLAFSAISGKQPHYLLPEFPALALVVARALTAASARDGGFWRAADHLVPAVFFVTVAAVIAGAFHFDLKPSWATSVGDARLWPLAAVAAAVLVFLRLFAGTAASRTAAVCGLSVVLVVAVHLTLRPLMAESHDFRPFSQTLKRFEDQGFDFVTFGKYHGQFQFLGRLTRPFGVVDGPAELDRWLKDHPKAMIVALHETLPAGPEPEAVTRFRSRVIGVWRADRYPARADRLKKQD